MGYIPYILDIRPISSGIDDLYQGAKRALRIDSGTLADYTYIIGQAANPNIGLYANSHVEIMGKSTATNGLIFRCTNEAGLYALDFLGEATFATIESKTNNADLYLKTNGSGLIKMGSFTSDATVTQSGYITIKDSGGTTRYLSCITP